MSAMLLRPHDVYAPFNGPAGLIFVIQERGQAFARIIGSPRHQDEVACFFSARNKPFMAMDPPSRAGFFSPRLDHAGV